MPRAVRRKVKCPKCEHEWIFVTEVADNIELVYRTRYDCRTVRLMAA